MIFQLIAGILHLGNIEFKPKEKQGSNVTNASGEDP
jgi:myosin heavy subunit